MTMPAYAAKQPPPLICVRPEPSCAVRLRAATALRVLRRRSGATAMVIAALCAAGAAHAVGTPVLVDFDRRADGSALALASGQVLRDDVVLPYLADFGITIADRTRPNTEVRIAHYAQAGASSGTNVFAPFAAATPAGGPWAYRMVFSQPVENVSFVRAALLGAFTTHDGWQISAVDALGSVLGSVGEGQVSQFGGSPEAQARRFDLPFAGIASLVVQGNLSAGGQTFESPVIDDLRFASPSPVPEPSSAWLALAGGPLTALWLHLTRRLQGRHTTGA